VPILRLAEDAVVRFIEREELGMGLQVGRTGTRSEYQYLAVLGAAVALSFDSHLRDQARAAHERRWGNPGVPLQEQQSDFLAWLGNLQPMQLDVVDPDEGRAVLGFIFHGPQIPIVPPPPRPAQIYGHLPFRGASGEADVYYRCEPFPTSRRIDQTNRTVASGTYAAPASELPFMPTGLAAVARYALPSLFPARWRWELQPSAGTMIDYGASVPLYGQSGGGVEVMFPNGATNRGPIANPVVLPVL
jgi:hypothetical protein